MDILHEVAAIFSTGDVTRVDELFAPGYLDHQRPDDAHHEIGPDEFREIVGRARADKPDLHVEVVGDTIRNGPVIVGLLRWTSRDLGRLTLETLRVDGGRIVEHWGTVVDIAHGGDSERLR